jgi:hypothetical protein
MEKVDRGLPAPTQHVPLREGGADRRDPLALATAESELDVFLAREPVDERRVLETQADRNRNAGQLQSQSR